MDDLKKSLLDKCLELNIKLTNSKLEDLKLKTKIDKCLRMLEKAGI